MSNNLDQIMVTFFEECDDLLTSLSEDLDSLKSAPEDMEIINSIFRAVHSIKGGAGAFGLDSLVKFAHSFETVLNDLRNGDITVNDTVTPVLWRSNDLLSDLVATSQSGGTPDKAAIDALIEDLNALRPDHLANAEPEELDFTPMGMPISMDLDLGGPIADTVFHITFKPDSRFYQNGNETAFFLRALEDLGTVEALCDITVLPDFDDFDPDQAYLAWEITLSTQEPEHLIHEVFEFAEGSCELIIKSDSALIDLPDLTPPDPVEPTIEALPEMDNVTELVKKKPADKPVKTATVRVDVNRVDRLINLVGELVVSQAILTQCVEELNLPSASELEDSIDSLILLSREIQDSVMTIRAQPVKPLFQRMSRIVRETSAATGKSVHLEVIGETTEVDKTVIEKLADPLTHMLRNAIDHGLESTEGRLAAGKPETGVVTLSAAHRSGRVVIEVSDDGAGINRERVKQIAIEKGLVAPDAILAPEEIDSILFMAGFSTVDEVSELSGRGVGMDVVKNAIHSLGGQIAVSSTPGQGSKFSISLPLTLAVLDGMIVELSQQRFILPITAIVELFRPGTEKIHRIDPQTSVISVRGENIRLVDVGSVLGIRTAPCDFEKSVLILIDIDDGSRFAMAFDEIQDQRQVVIKSLETNYQNVLGVAAATILGDGQIALILDPNDPAYGSRPKDKSTKIELEKTG